MSWLHISGCLYDFYSLSMKMIIFALGVLDSITLKPFDMPMRIENWKLCRHAAHKSWFIPNGQFSIFDVNFNCSRKSAYCWLFRITYWLGMFDDLISHETATRYCGISEWVIGMTAALISLLIALLDSLNSDLLWTKTACHTPDIRIPSDPVEQNQNSNWMQVIKLFYCRSISD